MISRAKIRIVPQLGRIGRFARVGLPIDTEWAGAREREAVVRHSLGSL
jgi:hypothetical protein